MLEKTYFLSRHGCAKNQVDAELIVGYLSQEGWKLIDEPEKASLIIINSCGFIESAKSESLDAVFQARKINPKAKLLLAGCLAERYAQELSENLPEADAFFGNADISKITEVLKSLFSAKNDQATNFSHKNKRQKRVWLYPQKGVSCGARPKSFNYPASTYIKITEGCNNCCSFCAIPLIRGSVRSRTISEIVDEIKNFTEQGIYEFNLIGQDLAAFKSDDSSEVKISGLAELLIEISKLKGNFIIRLLYIHPDNFPLDILPIMTSDKRFLAYFDLPFQSASEKILKAMNRRGNAEKYLALIEKIRTAFKKTDYKTAYIRSTFLTGFPGETEADFQESVNFIEEAKPLWSGAFDFSPEEGTKSVFLPNPIPKEIAIKRKKLLEEKQFSITKKLLDNFIGEKLLVLVEEIIDNPNDEKYFVLGRAWFQAPEVDGCIITLIDDKATIKKIFPGSKILVKVRARNTVDLEADFLKLL